jgi:hypothetical protein
MREQPSGQEIKTPIVPAIEIGKEQYCNVNQNNELVISIIFQHINMIIFLFQFTSLNRCQLTLLNDVPEVWYLRAHKQ